MRRKIKFTIRMKVLMIFCVVCNFGLFFGQIRANQIKMWTVRPFDSSVDMEKTPVINSTEKWFLFNCSGAMSGRVSLYTERKISLVIDKTFTGARITRGLVETDIYGYDFGILWTIDSIDDVVNITLAAPRGEIAVLILRIKLCNIKNVSFDFPYEALPVLLYGLMIFLNSFCVVLFIADIVNKWMED